MGEWLCHQKFTSKLPAVRQTLRPRQRSKLDHLRGTCVNPPLSGTTRLDALRATPRTRLRRQTGSRTRTTRKRCTGRLGSWGGSPADGCEGEVEHRRLKLGPGDRGVFDTPSVPLGVTHPPPPCSQRGRRGPYDLRLGPEVPRTQPSFAHRDGRRALTTGTDESEIPDRGGHPWGSC